MKHGKGMHDTPVLSSLHLNDFRVQYNRFAPRNNPNSPPSLGLELSEGSCDAASAVLAVDALGVLSGRR